MSSISRLAINLAWDGLAAEAGLGKINEVLSRMIAAGGLPYEVVTDGSKAVVGAPVTIAAQSAGHAYAIQISPAAKAFYELGAWARDRKLSEEAREAFEIAVALFHKGAAHRTIGSNGS